MMTPVKLNSLRVKKLTVKPVACMNAAGLSDIRIAGFI